MTLTTQAVAEQAAQAVKDRKPWSLLRIGDGDCIFLGYPQVFTLDRFRFVMRTMWGDTDLGLSDMIPLREAEWNAYRAADVLGIAPFGEKGGEWDVGYQWAEASGLLDGKPLCTVDIAANLWLGGHFDAILAGAKSVCLVTCRDVAGRFAARFPWVERVVHIPVPHEWHAERDRPYTERHWPDGYNRIMRQVAACDADVFLVGAGAPGKAYAALAAHHGAVALEIGSLFDGWAGMTHSRQYLRQGNREEWSL